MRRGNETNEKLCSLKREEIMALKGFGKSGMECLEEHMEHFGLKLMGEV
jgi:DNA-directed RNA polymerase alpha subunit